MKWKVPSVIKVYEALGCIADDRIEVNGLEAKVFSSSRKKFYSVKYEPESNSIMVNDNGSFYLGYLGYPAIAYLMKIGELRFSDAYASALKGIMWKDLNVKHDRNKGVGVPDYDFDAVISEIDFLIEERGINLDVFHDYLEIVLDQIKVRNFNLLGEKVEPPKGY